MISKTFRATRGFVLVGVVAGLLLVLGPGIAAAQGGEEASPCPCAPILSAIGWFTMRPSEGSCHTDDFLETRSKIPIKPNYDPSIALEATTLIEVWYHLGRSGGIDPQGVSCKVDKRRIDLVTGNRQIQPLAEEPLESGSPLWYRCLSFFTRPAAADRCLSQ